MKMSNTRKKRKAGQGGEARGESSSKSLRLTRGAYLGCSVKDAFIKYPVCHFVDPHDFPDDIELAVVFGRNGENAIFVTDTDEVFSFGSENSKGVLGVGHNETERRPKKVAELCGNNIIDIKASSHHALALTSGGIVYTWGENKYLQLGNGTNVDQFSPTICRDLLSHAVKQLACGYYHCLALTSHGEVWGWGNNEFGQRGQTENLSVAIPTLVQGLPSSSRVTDIQSGGNSSFALNAKGQIYGWGQIRYCLPDIQGYPSTPSRLNDTLNIDFTSIACTCYNILALRKNGNVMEWRFEPNYDRWCGSTRMYSFPPSQNGSLTHDFHNDRVKTIAADIYSSMCAALTEHGKVMIWGNCGGTMIKCPTVTSCSNLYEAFATIAEPANTYKGLTIIDMVEGMKRNPVQTILSALDNNVDNEEVSDVKFVVEGQTLFGHVSFLRMRSEHLKTWLGSNWEEGNREIEVNGHSYASFKSYLKFLYTGHLEVNDGDALNVLYLANEYREQELAQLCAKHLVRIISVDNVLTLYHAAKQMDVKELVEQCFIFIIERIPEVMESEAFDKLDPVLAKQLLREMAGPLKFVLEMVPQTSSKRAT